MLEVKVDSYLDTVQSNGDKDAFTQGHNRSDSNPDYLLINTCFIPACDVFAVKNDCMYHLIQMSHFYLK